MKRWSFLVILCAAALGACAPCDDVTRTLAILPPANGDAATDGGRSADAEAPSHDECVKLCDDRDVVSCRYDTRGGAPVVQCEIRIQCIM